MAGSGRQFRAESITHVLYPTFHFFAGTIPYPAIFMNGRLRPRYDSSMAVRHTRLRTTLPADYVRSMIEIAAERGVDPASVLDGTHLVPDMLETPGLRIASRDAAHIVGNACRLTGDRALGVEFGLRMRPTLHGYLGYAAMSCGTVREALALVIRYLHLRERDVCLQLSVEGAVAILEARDSHELGPLRQLYLEGMMIGLFCMAAFLIEEDQPEGELWFDWPEPDYIAPFRERLPAIRFAMPAVQLRLPVAYLDRRLATADRSALKLAIELCDRELAISSSQPEDFLARVRAELTPGAHGYPDLEQVASSLCMSGRSLKRRLEQRGTCFQTLLDEARHREALRLLADPDLQIQQIAAALGYQDPPSFTRAFRRWTGSSPVQVRTRLTCH